MTQPAQTSGNLRFIGLIVAVATIGGFMFGYDSGAINGTTRGLATTFGLDEGNLGLTASSLLPGCALGAFMAGRLADILGRRAVMLAAAVLFILALKGLSHPETARRGNAFGIAGMTIAVLTTLAVVAEALDKLGPDAKKIVPVLITIDPERDTPAVLADYVKTFGPTFVGLTGTTEQIKDVEKKFRVYAVKRPLEGSQGKDAGYGVDHSNVMYLVGPDGKTVSFYTDAISPDDLAKDLKSKI